MQVLVNLSMSAIAFYTIALVIKEKGIPYSISATYFSLKNKIWFLVTTWLTAGLLMYPVLEISKAGTEGWAFAACAGMFLVGVAPNFKDRTEGIVHDIGAGLCLVGSQVWVALNQPWVLFIWAAYVVYTVVVMLRRVSDSVISDFIRTRPMFWIEITAIISVYITVMVK